MCWNGKVDEHCSGAYLSVRGCWSKYLGKGVKGSFTRWAAGRRGGGICSWGLGRWRGGGYGDFSLGGGCYPDLIPWVEKWSVRSVWRDGRRLDYEGIYFSGQSKLFGMGDNVYVMLLSEVF